jgi:hypothetical protein
MVTLMLGHLFLRMLNDHVGDAAYSYDNIQEPSRLKINRSVMRHK